MVRFDKFTIDTFFLIQIFKPLILLMLLNPDPSLSPLSTNCSIGCKSTTTTTGMSGSTTWLDSDAFSSIDTPQQVLCSSIHRDPFNGNIATLSPLFFSFTALGEVVFDQPVCVTLIFEKTPFGSLRWWLFLGLADRHCNYGLLSHNSIFGL